MMARGHGYVVQRVSLDRQRDEARDDSGEGARWHRGRHKMASGTRQGVVMKTYAGRGGTMTHFNVRAWKSGVGFLAGGEGGTIRW